MRPRWIIAVSPILTALILAYGISQLVRADSMTGAGGTSIDASACVTTTTNSLCARTANLATVNPAVALTVNSFLDRTRWTTAIPAVYPSAATGNDLTAGAAPAWTSGAWVQFVASTATVVNIVGITCGRNTLTFVNLSHEIDIGTGAGGSEAVIGTTAMIWELPGASGMVQWHPVMFPIPLQVATSTRVAARNRSSTADYVLVGCKILYYPNPL